MKRGLVLFIISLKQIPQKLAHDLAREIVVAVCTAIILALVAYIAQDFLNVEIKSISTAMRNRFAQALAIMFLILVAILLAKPLTMEWQHEASLSRWARRIGESAQALNLFVTLWSATLILLAFTLYWYVCETYLYHFSVEVKVGMQVGGLVLIAFFAYLRARLQRTQNTPLSSEQITHATSLHSVVRRLPIMTRWRLAQILLRNRLTQLCLVTSFLVSTIALVFIHIEAPAFVAALMSFIAGTFAAMVIAFQIQEDLAYAWCERHWGVSHEAFVDTYDQVAKIISIVGGGVIAIAAFLLMLPTSSTELITPLSLSLKLGVIFAIPIMLMPFLAFQIDPHRPPIQSMLVLLIGIIIVTATYASWLGVGTYFLFRYYAKGTQLGRFYRA